MRCNADSQNCGSNAKVNPSLSSPAMNKLKVRSECIGLSVLKVGTTQIVAAHIGR
jgi:hypothetical protein